MNNLTLSESALNWIIQKCKTLNNDEIIAALVSAGGFEIKDQNENSQLKFMGKHYFVGGYSRNKRILKSIKKLGDQEISINLNVFKELKGKVLDLYSVINTETGYSNKILIAK